MARNSFYEGDIGTEVAIDTSASEAAASATAAASSATGAASSASAAATSATNAASSFDSFDDRYLGAKSSAPSVDNDGDALVAGALYWNTSSDQMFVREGSSWIAIKPTSTEQGHINTVSGIQANVTTVAGVASDVTTVAGISSDVAAVENIAANVTTVAGISSNVTSVAGNASNITAVAGNNSNITAVAGNATNINAVAADATDIGVVAGKATEIGRLGTADAVADMAILGTTDVVADMNTLATSDIVADMNTLATSDIVADMAILGASGVVDDLESAANNSSNISSVANNSSNINTVAGNNTNINTVAGNNANINTVATNISGINSFADRWRVASSAPTSSLNEGDLYYNTTTNAVYYYNGSAWAAIQSYSVQDGQLSQNNFTDADHSKLNAIEASATADQTNAEIKTAVEAGSDIALAGNPTTTTQSLGNDTTRIATTAFVQAATADLVDSAPSTLDTLNELAAALGDDANFSTTTTNNIATKVPLAGGTMTGALTLSGNPTATNHAANKAYVDTQVAAVPDAVAMAIALG